MLFQSEVLFKSRRGFSLNPSQHQALSSLWRWAEAGEHAVLEGYAGTGKTTVLTLLTLEMAMKARRKLHVATPTHKAAKVINTELGEWRGLVDGEIPEAVTIHSLLSLKPKRVRPGEPEAFVQSGRPRVERGAFLIVDECSMVGQELFAHVMECAAAFGLTVLFTGDVKQLRPVNESKPSRAFSLENKVSLTEVVRHGGPILNLATSIRTMHKHALPRVQSEVDYAGRVVAYRSAPNLEESWLNQLEDTHDSEDDIQCVMVCWTNRARRSANRRARERLYGTEVPDFRAGDRLVTLAAFSAGDQVILNNNADIEVESAERTRWRPVSTLPYEYDCWALKIRNSTTIHVLTDDEVDQHKKDCKKLGKELSALNEKAKAHLDGVERAARGAGASGERMAALLKEARQEYSAVRDRWRDEYFPLKDAFASVDFGYALTVHKSQGSTYDVVYAHPDMLESKEERPALMYVAVTRARKEVHHLALPC